MNSILRVVLLASFLLGLLGCASPDVKSIKSDDYQVRLLEYQGRPKTTKNIFVFFDGTRNTDKSNTNVWRLFKIVERQNDPQAIALYIEGVGTSYDAPITGPLLGRGMQSRILTAYRYVANNYKSGDNLYIFGFSRGAHQARALSGMLAYVGIPKSISEDKNKALEMADRLLELLKKQTDEQYSREWKNWKKGSPPVLENKVSEKLNIDVKPVTITFLGLWDTVPGSSLKNYGRCKEERGFIKRYFYWLIPGIDKGERYKTDSYPVIENLVHAVSKDEKRSKFRPLLLCEPMNKRLTQTSEIWFPGAHADIGGGYDDSQELPSLTLKWMIEKLSSSYKFISKPNINGNALGLAHWSIGDRPANIGSKCEDRVPGPGAILHPSYYQREDARHAPMRCGREIVSNFRYPVKCNTACQ